MKNLKIKYIFSIKITFHWKIGKKITKNDELVEAFENPFEINTGNKDRYKLK